MSEEKNKQKIDNNSLKNASGGYVGSDSFSQTEYILDPENVRSKRSQRDWHKKIKQHIFIKGSNYNKK